jgi:DNA repair protein RadD
MRHLRPYQNEMVSGVNYAWDQGATVVVLKAPTGSGKGEVIRKIAQDVSGNGVLMAHRRELVSQLSIAFAHAGIAHNLMVAKDTRNMIIRRHMKKFGHTTYNASARWSIGTVGTVNVRAGKTREWAESIENVFNDEGHHVLRHNQWGKAFSLFPNKKRGLLPTATESRADGIGLGSWAGGIADALVEGPQMAWLIENAYLCPYKIYAVRPSDIDLSGVTISEVTGEFNEHQLAEAVKASKTIIGDVVETYIENAYGELGITFAVDIEHGQKIADHFNKRGVPAKMVSSKSTDDEREAALDDFEAGKILQLVNVDLFGEGFDLPNVQCISMARPTASFIVYAQEFGRVLRMFLTDLQMEMWDTFSVSMRKEIIANSGKPFGKVFDHVANIYRHLGPPDKPRVSSLDSRSKRNYKPGDAIPLTGCTKCFKPFPKFHTKCPHCGTAIPQPSARGGAQEVDGNIYLLSDEVLRQMRGQIVHIAGDAVVPYGKPELGSIVRSNHQERQKQQHLLRTTMNMWAGTYPQYSNETNYKQFYFLFGIDVIGACTLGAGDAEKLRTKIVKQMAERGIVINY